MNIQYVLIKVLHIIKTWKGHIAHPILAYRLTKLSRYLHHSASLIFILLITGMEGKAQFIKRPVSIEPKVYTGMILPLNEAMNYLIKDDVYAFDISVGFPTYGKDYWEKLYNYPKSGFGCSYWNFGNNEILGEAYALYSYINIPFLKFKEKASFNYQISLGGAYLSKKFDKYDNHLEQVIGSHANAYIRLGIDGRIKLLPSLEMVIAAGGSHFSNGKTKAPNYGINTSSFSLGLNFHFRNNSVSMLEPEVPVLGKRYVQSVIYSAGAKVYDNLLGKRYFISSGAYNLERIINYKMKIGIGADFFYDGSISEALASKDGTPEKDFTKLIRAGVHTSYAIRYKQIIMGVQVGYYLYSKYTVFTSIYNRLSVQYLMTNNLIGSIAIKSHMGNADFLEWGIGYCW